MNIDSDARLPAPLRLDVDVDLPLGALTASVNEICREAEGRARAVVVLWLPGPSSDRAAWPSQVGIQDVNRWERALRRLERLGASTISMVGGTCHGPELDLLLATDYRIATSEFRLLLPSESGQFWPGMAMHRLANQVGVARARQLLLSGRGISTQRALDIGLIDEISTVATDALSAAAVRLGELSGAELAIRRQLLFEAPATSFDEALGAHLAACDRELRRRRETLESDDERRIRIGR